MLYDNINRTITTETYGECAMRFALIKQRRDVATSHGISHLPGVPLGSPTQPVADQSLKRWVAPKCSALGGKNWCEWWTARFPGRKMDGREMTIKSYKNTFIWDLYGIYLGFIWFIWDLSGCRLFSEGELYGSEKFPILHGGSLATPNTQTG